MQPTKLHRRSCFLLLAVRGFCCLQSLRASLFPQRKGAALRHRQVALARHRPAHAADAVAAAAGTGGLAAVAQAGAVAGAGEHRGAVAAVFAGFCDAVVVAGAGLALAAVGARGAAGVANRVRIAQAVAGALAANAVGCAGAFAVGAAAGHIFLAHATTGEAARGCALGPTGLAAGDFVGASAFGQGRVDFCGVGSGVGRVGRR